jgi:hypothetical protein
MFRRNLEEKALFGFSTAIIALPLLNSIFIPNFRDPAVSVDMENFLRDVRKKGAMSASENETQTNHRF